MTHFRGRTAAYAVANGTATPKQQAIAFQNNQAINQMGLTGKIPQNVYQANQSAFMTRQHGFVHDAAYENGLTAKLQQTKPGELPKPGTDTDVLVEKRMSGKPITSEQIANTTESYNRKVEKFLRESGVKTTGKGNWARITDTDFMPVPSHTTPEEFSKIAAETNKRGGTMYTDPRAAEVEARRWQNSYDNHYGWCITVSKESADSETRARVKGLQECATKGATTPRKTTEGSSSSGRPKYFAILFSHYRTSQESYQKFPECRFLRIDGPWPIEQAKPGEIDSMVSKLKAAGNANVEAKYFYSQQEAEKFKEVRNNKVNADLDRCTTAQNRYVDSVRKGKQ